MLVKSLRIYAIVFRDDTEIQPQYWVRSSIGCDTQPLSMVTPMSNMRGTQAEEGMFVFGWLTQIHIPTHTSLIHNSVSPLPCSPARVKHTPYQCNIRVIISEVVPTKNTPQATIPLDSPSCQWHMLKQAAFVTALLGGILRSPISVKPVGLVGLGVGTYFFRPCYLKFICSP